ncbi:MAG: nucleoside transporter C-terminal domain-containing protein [Candidatus Sumerlaeia bacterium]|nr:nucleoside transporter C-terminal domain-containing protein [Candidatus Sumerlaeia bacterium]
MADEIAMPNVESAVTLVDRLIPVLGLAVFLALAWAMSSDRKRALANWRIVVFGLGLQFAFAVLVLRTAAGEWFFERVNDFFLSVIDAAGAGSQFMFGSLALTPDKEGSLGFFFAFNVLPIIILFSALSALLYHIGALQVVVRGLAWVMQRTMGTSGAETFSGAANIFLGQTEAPLLVRPFIPKMTKSEIHAVMAGGFANIAGSVMASYIGILGPVVPDIAGHLLAASVMSAPAALLFAKVVRPETEVPVTRDVANVDVPKEYDTMLDAVTGGTTEGLKLALNVAAMLISFLAILALVDAALEYAAGAALYAAGEADAIARHPAFNLRAILGRLCRPIAWLMGVPWHEAEAAGRLIGVKTVANEFIAYLDLAAMRDTLSERSSTIMSYALCGFANLGSLGIQIGGLSILAPERRVDVVAAAVPAMIAGTLATFSTACFAAILL